MRILFVTSSSSPHAVRWISQVDNLGWDIHLLPATERFVQPGFRRLTIHPTFAIRRGNLDRSVRQAPTIPWPFQRGRERLRRVCESLSIKTLLPATRMVRLVDKLRPDVVHSTHVDGGALAVATREAMGSRFPPWIHSTWGSDLTHFVNEPSHGPVIQKTLELCDYLITDCERDQGIARQLGFMGEFLGVFPTAGGYDLDAMQGMCSSGPPSSRRTILLKGREAVLGGRALVAMQAIEECAAELRDYEIVIVLPSRKVIEKARDLERKGLRFRALPVYTPHEEVLRITGRARISIGLGMMDGTPNTMLEAMAMGAFPIQSDTAATEEWIRSGENGFAVPPEDPVILVAALREGLRNDDLIDRAAEINRRETRARIDTHVVVPLVVDAYRRASIR